MSCPPLAPPRRPRLRPAALLVGVLLPLLAAPAAQPASAPANAGDPRPNILIVVLDACRADRLSTYGFARATTPTLDTLASDPDTVRFARHYVQAPWTKPSTASLFTGLRVSQHKVYRGHTREKERRAKKTFVTDRLADEQMTLAERMKSAGLSTFGVAWGRQLEPEYGFAQGFDQYFTQEVKTDRDRVAKILDLAAAATPPFFGYVHFEACHLPFPPRDRHAGYMDEHPMAYDEAARQTPGIDVGDGELVYAINMQGLELSDDDDAFLDLVYQAKMRHMDEVVVAPLLAGLRERGLDENLLLVVTADHGEELYEHGTYGHSQGLWNEILHVPLLVRFPKGRKPEALPRVVDEPTQTIGLVPSLIEAVGLPEDPSLPGADLFAGETPPYAVSEMSPIWGARGFVIIEGDYKLLHLNGGNLLTNLTTDPGERTNLAAAEPARVALMSAKALELKRYYHTMAQSAPLIDVKLDPEAVEQLRALGYLE